MCLCMYRYTCVCAYSDCVCVPVWKPEVSLGWCFSVPIPFIHLFNSFSWVCKHAFMNLYAPHVCSSLWGPEKGIIPALELSCRWFYELACGYLELNLAFCKSSSCS